MWAMREPTWYWRIWWWIGYHGLYQIGWRYMGAVKLPGSGLLGTFWWPEDPIPTPPVLTILGSELKELLCDESTTSTTLTFTRPPTATPAAMP
jgi:hypothetical protein